MKLAPKSILEKINSCKSKKKRLELINAYLDDQDFLMFLSKWIMSLDAKKIDREVSFLVACSQSKSMVIRDDCAQLFGRFPHKNQMITNALALLIDDKSWVVRCSAMYSIGIRREKSYTHRIIDRYYKSWSCLEKKWAFFSLIKMNDVLSEPFFERIYSYSKNKNHKCLAATGLAIMGYSHVCEYLKGVFSSNEKNPELDVLDTCLDLLKESNTILE